MIDCMQHTDVAARSAMLASWVRANHVEAGNFIHTMTDGEVKNAAIRAFAETIPRIDVESAGRWPEALPPGPQKDQTIRAIRHSSGRSEE